MTSIALRALRTVGALALALAATSPSLAVSPQPEPPGFNPQPDPPRLCLLGRSSLLAPPHNPPTC
jgi:hypothetical protein